MTLEITDSYRTITTEVEYKTEKETIVEGKSPSIKQIKQWDDEITRLHTELEDMGLRLSEHRRKDLEYSKDNLFFDSENISIAFANLDRTLQEIAKLKIELEKLRSLYASQR